MDDPSNPTPLPARALCLLERIDAEGGEWLASFTDIAEACGIARSTAQLAVRDLIEAGLVAVTPGTAGNGSRYARTDHTDRVPTPRTDPVPTGYTDRVPTVSSDAHEGAPTPPHEQAHAPAQNPLPTPLERQTATDLAVPPCAPASAHAHEERVPTEPVPTDAVPIGRLAVAAAIEAATAGGRTVDAALRGRIGATAQALAATEDSTTIIAAARRLGAGGHADLRTAVAAVKEERPPGSAVRTAPDAIRTALDASAPKFSDLPRIQATVALVLKTWPRAQIDVPTWEAELRLFREDELLDSVRELARAGSEWGPTWGQVYKVAKPLAERRRRDAALEAHWQRERDQTAEIERRMAEGA